MYSGEQKSASDPFFYFIQFYELKSDDAVLY